MNPSVNQGCHMRRWFEEQNKKEYCWGRTENDEWLRGATGTTRSTPNLRGPLRSCTLTEQHYCAGCRSVLLDIGNTWRQNCKRGRARDFIGIDAAAKLATREWGRRRVLIRFYSTAAHRVSKNILGTDSIEEPSYKTKDTRKLLKLISWNSKIKGNAKRLTQASGPTRPLQ